MKRKDTNCGVADGELASVEVGGKALECFPFTRDFASVVDGRVTMRYLREVRKVLEPAVDVLSAELAVKMDACNGGVQVLLCALAALGRLKVVDAYEEEVLSVAEYAPGEVLDALNEEWEAMLLRDKLLEVPCGVIADAYLGNLLQEVWEHDVTGGFGTLTDLADSYPMLLPAMRFTRVGSVLVVSPSGRNFDDMTVADASLPVMSERLYRQVLDTVRDSGVHDADGKVDASRVVDGSLTLARVMCVSCADAANWVWLVAYGSCKPADYCYQDLFPPSQRLVVCQVLGKLPLVRELMWYVGGCMPVWARCDAQLVVGDMLHVVQPGNADVSVLSRYEDRRIGVATPITPTTDFFARALFDEFVNRHSGKAVALVPSPVDAEFEALTIDPNTLGRRGFVDLASGHYAGVNEALSPRVEHRQLTRSVVTREGRSAVDDVDSDRLVALCNRLACGPVVSEIYFDRMRSRLRRVRRRPELADSGGRCYHLFAGFPAAEGAGLGDWAEDVHWTVPGWTSYVAHFAPSVSKTVAFVVPGGAVDARMDCTGVGAMEFGHCTIALQGTVLWFSDSVRFKVKTRDEWVDLRISIPLSGTAAAVPTEMRRYLHIPGYAMVALSYDVVSGSPAVGIPLSASDQRVCAGSRVLVGSLALGPGRHRFKLAKLLSAAPVKLILKTEPVEALEYLSVCGMRAKPHVRDYVCVLYDVGNADSYVSLGTDAVVRVSVLQVVNDHEFDITVASVRAAGV